VLEYDASNPRRGQKVSSVADSELFERLRKGSVVWNAWQREHGYTLKDSLSFDPNAVLETNEAWARKLKVDRNIGDFRQWKSHDRYQESLARVLYAAR
jgi:hypothetical protein